jgi:vesicle-associated membrane protein 7
LNTKTEGLLDLAKDYNNNADELRKIMYWRNMKLKVIMGMMGGATAISLVVPIMQKFAT